MTIKMTPEKKTAFLAALAETGVVRKACRAIDMSREHMYKLRDGDEEFREQWNRALRIGMGNVEDALYERAVEGVEEPVFHMGLQCGAVRKYSDTAAIFLLKAHDPKYRERQGIELTGANGGPLNIQDDTTAAAARIAAILEAARVRKAAAEAEATPPDDNSDIL